MDDGTQPSLNVRIERLEPMRAARFPAFGSNPEEIAWSNLRRWAEPQGFLADPSAHPVFGFNNPSPKSPGEQYGYEFWIAIEPGLAVPEEVETIDFPGGWYAALTRAGPPDPGAWTQLVNWVRNSPHRYRADHELEHPRNPTAPSSEMVFDLYLPVEPAAAAGAKGIRVRGADFVVYPVSVLAAAAKFYREVLELPQGMYSEQWQWAEFNCGNITLALKGGETLPAPGTTARIALAVPDIRAAYDDLKAKGARLPGEPVDYGVCSAFEVLDPDGNTLIVHHRTDGTWGP